MRMDGLPFKAAVEKLLVEGGVVQRCSEMPLNQSAPEVPELEIAPERAAVLLERVIAIYEKNLQEAPEGKAYLEKRGITDAGLWTRHRVGYSTGKLAEMLPAQGVGESPSLWDELKALGILLPNGQERFAGCVVFPVMDTEGRLVTLYGRFTGAGDKRHFYLPGRPTGLWQASTLKSYGHLILVESILDALSVQMAGYQNVISIQGGNGLKDAALLSGYGVQRITLLMDGDEAGRAAAQRLRNLLSGYRCEAIRLPEGSDPNSHLTAHGAASLAQLLAAEPETRSIGMQPIPGGFAVSLGARRYEIRGLEKGPRKLRATVRVEHAGKIHVDTLDLYSARWRRQLAQDLCQAFEESPETVQSDIAKLITLCEEAQATPSVIVETPPAMVMTPEERKEGEAMGRNPELISQIMSDYEHCGLVGELNNKLLCYLAMTSRKLQKPLSVLILSSSGAGKTALQDTALQFCPPEDLVKLTSLSGKALFYKESTSLKNKVLALEEGDGVEEATYALRNLISAGQLTIEATIKDLVTGKLTTMENRVEGPTSVFVTTTNPETDSETRSRFWVTAVDESQEQTQAILACQRQRQTLSGLQDTATLEPILRRHHHFQRLLKPLAIVNPYANQLSYGDNRLQSRRDQPKYLNLINAIALLRQMHKPIKRWGVNGLSREYVEADREDIRIANALTIALLGQTLDELSRPGYELLMRLEARTQEESAKRKSECPVRFTRREIREATGWSQSRVHRYLTELVDLEYVLTENGRNGQLQTYRLLYEGQGKDGQKFVLGLQSAEDLRDP